MFRRRAPAFVFLLADHLDSLLAAGEDLIAHGRAWSMAADCPLTSKDGQCERRKILENVRGYEMMLVARVLKAREHAFTLAKTDSAFAPVASLFASGTAVLLDAVVEAGDSTAQDFDTADGLLPYARSRGLVPADAASIETPSALAIGDTFLVARRISLGPLLDMAGAFLDALDAQYGVFEEDNAEGTSANPVTQKMLPVPPPLAAARSGA